MNLAPQAKIVNECKQLLQQDQIEEAEQLLIDCAQSFPDAFEVKKIAAGIAMKRADFDSAYIKNSELVKEYPDDATGYLGIGSVLLKQNIFDEAEDVFRFCAKSFPDNLEAKDKYALVALKKLDFEAAYARYVDILNEYPDSAIGYLGVGNVFLGLNHYDAAEEMFLNCMQLFPDCIDAREQHVYVALKKGDIDAAYDRVQKIIEDHPNNVGGHLKYIETLIRKSCYCEAEEAVKNLILKFSDRFSANYGILVIYNKYLRQDFYSSMPFFTDLASLAYNNIVDNADLSKNCFDRNKLMYGALLGAKNIKTRITHRPSPKRSNTIAIFGDSSITTSLCHPEYFQKKGFDTDFFHIGGATITGLGKDNSRLGVFDKIEQYVVNQRPQYLFLKFGQGDLEFGYYYRKFIKQEVLSFSEFCAFLIDTYRKRINQINDLTTIVVLGVDYPSLIGKRQCAKRTMDIITRDRDWRSVNVALFDTLLSTQPSITERTDNSFKFNSMLRKMCRELGCYFSDTKDIFWANGHSCLDIYYQPHFDHHYLTTEHLKIRCIDHVLNTVMSSRKSA
ncbi:tetratricopeptide repeat protein [uncultured Pseudodesulfovibrio sp.]|uniref:tetratricopeptide repeat protein n=1 Tax=uncultured Pseudodesulfovibrio sp. TaxID=2035858 RepID=UPI003747E354